ncbi:MAG: 2OG-Fe(II) oxygenase [Bdellovibrionaceae bacterium]|nr:2OG-Fe(II) oxygenase [Bdellovibrionales bacterium]MCB9085115.1 2OG-Fe(II) oxygenase [Pseudobdellovibrionaceae bacterium]
MNTQGALANPDHIILISEAVPQNICRKTIELFENDSKVKPGLVYDANGGLVESADKKSLELVIDHQDSQWEPIHQALRQAIVQGVVEYIKDRPGLQVAPLQNTAFKIKKYLQGQGEFTWHFDALSAATRSRQLALIIYLNTVTEGGETEFFHQGIKIKPKCGDLALFPPFWTHMHCGQVPKSGPKFIITSFVEFKGL